MWSSQLTLCLVSVLCCWPAIPSLNCFPALKRKASTQLTANRLKNMKLVASAPSTVAKPSLYRAMQDDATGRVLDDHPVPDKGIPPIELLYPPFGDFLDTVYGGRNVDPMTLAEYKVKVDSFADSMTRFFQDEGFRQGPGLSYMNSIFDHDVWGARIVPAAILPSTKIQSDGHATTKDGFPFLVVEFKNSDANVQTHPRIQALGCIAKMHMETLSDLQPIYDKFRMPSLIITVVGECGSNASLSCGFIFNPCRGLRYVLCRDPAGCSVPFG